jgi:D-lactate dehydrogenase
MRITFFELREAWERSYVEQALAGQELRFIADPLTAETVGGADDAEAISVFIRSRIDRRVLENSPSLRCVTTRSTGFDHIDVEACAEHGIVVANVPRYGENTVAEHTFGLILNLSRKIHQAYERTKRCDFSLEGLEGFDLRGRTLGVIGAGAIGLHVIRIGRALGMSVLAHDVRPQPLIAEVLDFRYTSLEELLGAADVVTLHAPLLPDTHHLLDRKRYESMNRGALLVNTARGALVDTEALLWALEEGILAGAGLDVLEGEERLAEERHMFRTPESQAQLLALLANHRLLARENVIITPHMAWYSREARQRILQTSVANLAAYLAGNPIDVVAGPPSSQEVRRAP